jgi:hypothetical protein
MVIVPLLFPSRQRDSGLDDPMRRRQMEAMPRHDPVPPRRTAAPAHDREREAEAWARYKQTMKWMALAAVVTVLLALIWLKSFGDPVPVHMTIATILGVGLTVLVGSGLMGLVFLSSRSGADEEAGRPGDGKDEDR